MSEVLEAVTSLLKSDLKVVGILLKSDLQVVANRLKSDSICFDIDQVTDETMLENCNLKLKRIYVIFVSSLNSMI